MEDRDRDEYLEALWCMKEQSRDSLEDLGSQVHVEFDEGTLQYLASHGWIILSDDAKRVNLTEKGEGKARELIRAHRLAERLIYDVLGSTGKELESGACEFEHTVAPELVDSICTLLGHPRECPHGRPIPEGDCCRQHLRILQSSVVPLTELRVGEAARVAYIRCQRDDQMHRLYGLCIRPGGWIKLHQRYPAYVIECERGNIALEEKVAGNIYVWVRKGQADEVFGPGMASRVGRGRRRRWRFGRGAL
jgi:DtxR family Mn-dependent transcriptional regulator